MEPAKSLRDIKSNDIGLPKVPKSVEGFSYSRSQKIEVVIRRIRLVIFLRNGLDKHFIQSPSNLAQTLLWPYSSTDIISCMLHDYDTYGWPVSLSVCIPSRAHSLTKFGTDLALAYPMNPSKHKDVRSVPLSVHSSFCYLQPPILMFQNSKFSFDLHQNWHRHCSGPTLLQRLLVVLSMTM